MECLHNQCIKLIGQGSATDLDSIAAAKKSLLGVLDPPQNVVSKICSCVKHLCSFGPSGTVSLHLIADLLIKTLLPDLRGTHSGAIDSIAVMVPWTVQSYIPKQGNPFPVAPETGSIADVNSSLPRSAISKCSPYLWLTIHL